MKWTGYLSNFNCTLNRSFKDVSILSKATFVLFVHTQRKSPRPLLGQAFDTNLFLLFILRRENSIKRQKKSYIMKKARFSLQYLTTQARMLGMFNIFINLIGPHTKQIHTYVVHNFAYYLQSLVLFLKKNPNILQYLHLYQNCFEAQDILSGQNPLIWPLHIPLIQSTI